MSATAELRLNPEELRTLLDRLGPSLGLWRAAEIALLRTQPHRAPVLDLGCGDGIVTSLVLPRVAIGVDPSLGAARRASALGLYERLEVAPIETLAIPPASVGTIISNSVLEHVPNISAVLSAVARLLRPGGHLVYTVPTEAFTGWLALPLSAYGAWRNRHYNHRNLWSVEQWGYHLRQAGLTMVSVHPYIRRGIVAAWDALELAQRVHVGRHRVFGVCWRHMPPAIRARLAERLARLDLSAPPPGGGRMIVAQKD